MYSFDTAQPFFLSTGRKRFYRGYELSPSRPLLNLRNRGLLKAARLPKFEDSFPKETPSLSFIIRPTLSQMWPEREAGPPFTFKISMLHVFCSSHGLAHFAALFIDPRAK